LPKHKDKDWNGRSSLERIADASRLHTTSMIFFLKTQAGWRETSQVENMLPPEPEIPPDSAFQRLAAYLDAIRSRQQDTFLTAEPEPLPVSHAGGQDG
jgi:hypothetical protein